MSDSLSDIVNRQVKVNQAIKQVDETGSKAANKATLKRKASKLAERYFSESQAALLRIIAHDSAGMEQRRVKLHGGVHLDILMCEIPHSHGDEHEEYCHGDRATYYLGVDGRIYTNDYSHESTWSVLDVMGVYRDACHDLKFFGSSGMSFAKRTFTSAMSLVGKLQYIYPPTDCPTEKIVIIPVLQNTVGISRWLKLLAWFNPSSRTRVSAIEAATTTKTIEPVIDKSAPYQPRRIEIRSAIDVPLAYELRGGDIVEVVGGNLTIPVNVTDAGSVFIYVIGEGNSFNYDPGYNDGRVQFAPFGADYTYLELE